MFIFSFYLIFPRIYNRFSKVNQGVIFVTNKLQSYIFDFIYIYIYFIIDEIIICLSHTDVKKQQNIIYSFIQDICPTAMLSWCISRFNYDLFNTFYFIYFWFFFNLYFHWSINFFFGNIYAINDSYLQKQLTHVDIIGRIDKRENLINLLLNQQRNFCPLVYPDVFALTENYNLDPIWNSFPQWIWNIFWVIYKLEKKNTEKVNRKLPCEWFARRTLFNWINRKSYNNVCARD